ncbi:HNH endonuclease [Luteibacter yeojuensis]|uniref:HNH endonuclease n=1 Tax=Luteibacter yeojuensis TaxID=345309 RepID=UPI0006961554|nr:HNH endonuclease [Luteibacter yeojuensis]
MNNNAECVICARDMDAGNDSAEHVIPQAIGGRWVVTGFICRSCNSRAGGSWDAVLTKQLAWLSTIVGVVRERGEAPDVAVTTVEGEQLMLRSDGAYVFRRPTIAETADGNTFNISITGRSVAEVRQHLAGFKRRHPEVDIEAAMATITKTRHYIDNPCQTSLVFGGPEASASLIKTALAAAVNFGLTLDACDVAMTYLRTFDGPLPVDFFFARDLVKARPDDRILHCVSVRADSASGQALAYVDYFGLWRSIVILSRDYTGPAVSKTYAIDPTLGEEVALEVELDLDEMEVASILDGSSGALTDWPSVYARVMPMVLKRAEGRHRERLIEEGVTEAAAAFGLKPGDLIPEEKQEPFARLASRLIAEKVVEMTVALERLRSM